MNRWTRTLLALALALVFETACSGNLRRQTSSAAAAPGAEAIPSDPALRHGTLANGFTYYVRANKKPEHRAELRLLINAGSILEDDDQRGLAHFVEHMAFNGTKNFEKLELINYMERIGMRFGPDVNAYTSFDETVYMLEVPTDDEEIVATAFRILEDWAHQVTFEDEEIDKERGVVIEEWRQGRGAAGRIRDKHLPVTFHGSRYAERLTIGDKETLESAPYDALKRFYRDWYRPDLMAIVAVGDFDAAAIEGRVRDHFSKIRPPESPRDRVLYPVPDHDATLFSIVTDPEATSIDVAVGYKRPPAVVETVRDLRRSIVDGLYDGMMTARLRELAQKADPPYRFAFAGSGWLGRTKSMYRLFASVNDGGVERGVETLLTEAKRVELHGFTESELARSKADLLRRIQQQYEERDKQESSEFASDYAEHFLDGDPAPSITYVRDLFAELVPGIALDEINARAEQWISENNRVILVSGPQKQEAGIPQEPRLLSIFDGVERVAITPWVDQVRDEPLVPAQPTRGRIVEESTIEALGVTRFKLHNGSTVLLKPTAFKNDEIVIQGYSPGGTSLAPDSAFISASLASRVVSEMGAGNFSEIELDKALAGKVAHVGSFIGELSENVLGSASPQDLDTAFQLLYLRFAGARRDDEAFASFVSKTAGWLANQEASPEYQFNAKYSEIASQGHPRRMLLTSERLKQLDLETALDFYRERFRDASDFLFTLVGNFEVSTIRPQVERWIGGLPAGGRQETWRDVGVENPSGVAKFEVRRGIEPKSQVRITFHGPGEWSLLNSHLVSSLAAVLRIRLREVLREELGGVYGVGVFGGMSREPRPIYNLVVSFGCDPQRVDELILAVFSEIDAIRTRGPGEDPLSKVREAQTRQRETDLESNAFWAKTLEFYERNGLDLGDILRYDTLVAAVTQESMQEAARRYLSAARYIEGVLYPE